MIPTTRSEFKDFCFRALGSPVIQINVSDEQAEDRIDEAFYMYQQYHMDAVQKVYLSHEITPSSMVMTADITLGPDGKGFLDGEVIKSSTSAVTGYVDLQHSDDTLWFYTPDTQMFTVGETITGQRSGASGTIKTLTLGDFDNGFIPISDAIIGISRIFAPFDSRISADILFDPQSQFNISLLSNFTANSLVPYVLGRQYQQLMNDTLRGRPGIRYHRHMNRLYVDVNWYTTFRPHYFIIAEAYQVIDPDTYPNIWGERWLQKYATALIKQQWASVLSKYTGIPLPGGLTLDGKSMMTEAKEELKSLEDELKSAYAAPPMMVVG